MAEPTPDIAAGDAPARPTAAAADASTPPVDTRAAAFFDLDNTIIRGASAFHLAVGLWRRDLIGPRDIAVFAWQQARYRLVGENLRDIEQVRSRALSLVAGRTVAEITAVGEEIWDEVLSLRIFPGTHAILEEHLERGHQVWIITGSPVEIGELIGRRLGATGALGTVAEHREGFYTGRLVGDMMHGQAKADAVHELARTHGLDLERSYAYGDSLHDVAILSAVGHPFAINPDSRLKRHAQRAGWPVHEFRGRRRAATRRGVQTASLAGLLWVGSLVARSARRALRG